MTTLNKEIKNVGIVGLGLIGGSIAKTVRATTNCTIYAYDIDEHTLKKSISDGIVDFELNDYTISNCEMIIICLYPKLTTTYVIEHLNHFKENTLIVDCAGVKENICTSLSSLCLENNLNFIGGHPMAGIEKSGYEYSTSTLFGNATMVLCKDEYTNDEALKDTEEFFIKLGFKKITVSTFEEHDRIIAFTSQLAHVVSNAYVQNEQAKKHMGFSAGSYQDLTRVAYLNEYMWAELFIENKTTLSKEIRELSNRLEEFAKLIENEETENLQQLLRKGKLIKESIQ